MREETTTTSTTAAAPPLQRFDAWLASIPASSTTGWRWRREGRVRTVNIAGRQYITAAEVANFIRRAEAGEFSQEHVTPSIAGRCASEV
jgi:hypothetical protein